MKINNIGYLLKKGVIGIFLHGFMSFAAICVTIACLLIVGTFAALMYNMNIMVENLNQTNKIMVYVDETLSDARAKSVGTEINRVSNVLSSQFVTREEALQKFVEDQDNSATFSGVRPEDLRHRFEVVLEDNGRLQETIDEIWQISGVANITAAYEMAEGFSTIQKILNVASMVVTAVLLVVSLLIISNTVKLAMYDRKDEIAIMKMVGATNSFIRLPFMVEGFLLGTIGAALAFALEWFIYDTSVQQIAMADTLKLLDFCPFTDILQPMIITFAAAGVFVGIVGSWTSIRKFMNV